MFTSTGTYIKTVTGSILYEVDIVKSVFGENFSCFVLAVCILVLQHWKLDEFWMERNRWMLIGVNWMNFEWNEIDRCNLGCISIIKRVPLSYALHFLMFMFKVKINE